MADGDDLDAGDGSVAFLVTKVVNFDVDAGHYHTDRGDYGKDGPGFHIIGLCPRCQHPSSALCAAKFLAPDGDIDVIRAGKGRQRPGGGGIEQITVLRCACVESHEGSPADVFGCGAEWLLQVGYNPQVESNDATFLAVPEEEAARNWTPADSIADSIPQSVATAQASAKNWQTALTALLAIVGVAGIIGSRDTIQSLSASWQIAIGIAAFLAVAFNIAMLYIGDVASFGLPRIKKVLGPRVLLDADITPLKDAEGSVLRIRWSVWAALGSAVTAIAATAIFLFAAPSPSPTPGPTGSKLTVMLSDNTTLVTPCGLVKFDNPDNPTFVTFTPVNGSTADVVMYQLSKIKEIDAC